MTYSPGYTRQQILGVGLALSAKPFVKITADYEYVINFYVIIKTREIIRVSEIPDVCPTRVP